MYAYSETRYGGPTIDYVMTDNWIYGCCGFSKDLSYSNLGYTGNGHKKNSSQDPFCEP